MKKFVSIALAMLLVLSLCGCQKKANDDKPATGASISTSVSTSVSTSAETEKEEITTSEDDSAKVENTDVDKESGVSSETTETENVETKKEETVRKLPPQPEEKQYLLAEVYVAYGNNNYTIYRYDSLGNLIEEYGYDSYDPGYIHNQVKYTYNDKNQRIEEIGIKSGTDEKEINYRQEYEYNDDGKCIVEKHYDWNNELDYYYEYTYDSDGKVIERGRFWSWGEFNEKNVYEYDDKGNLVSDTRYDKEDTRKSYSTYEYEYDDLGFTIKKVEYFKDKLLWSYEYENNEYGNPTLTISYDGWGDLFKREEYEYDEYGNVIHTKTVSSDYYYLYGTVSQTAEELIELQKANVEAADKSVLAGDWFNYFDWMGTPPDDFEYLKISVSAEGTFVFDNMSSGHIVEGNVTEATVVDGKTVFSTDTDITITYDSASTITIAYGDTVERLYSPAAMY